METNLPLQAMTWAECKEALLQYDKRTYLLALVAQIHEPVLSKCGVSARPLADCALDATRRWCLGEATAEECRSATAAAYAYAAAYAASATYASSAAASYAAYDDDAIDDLASYAAARARLVESLADAPREWKDAVVADGNVRTATHVWRREGRFGGKWKRLTDEDLVRFDAVLEVATAMGA